MKNTENGFIVDVSNAHKTSEIIYELSNILDLPDAQSKKVCLRLGDIELSTANLRSIKALVESMNSQLEFVSTSSGVTKISAKELCIPLYEIENVIPAPEFDQDDVKVNKDLEKALDKIFGEEYREFDSKPAPENIEGIAKELADEPVRTPEEMSFVAEIEEELSEEDKEAMRVTEKLPTVYIKRTVRSGQSVASEGNLVIIGDVHPGAELIASGDISVWGILGGIAHAGSEGNKFARIRALKMNAIQLRIAEVFARRPDSANIPYIQKTGTFTPEEASVRKQHIIIEKLKD